MKKSLILVNNICSVCLTTIIFLLGGWDISLKLLIIVMVLDYLTGVFQAIYNGKLNSKIGLKGFIKKLLYLIAVSLSVVLDKVVGNTGTFRTLVIYFFVANDGISIVENMGKMGIPLPNKIKDALEQLKERE